MQRFSVGDVVEQDWMNVKRGKMISDAVFSFILIINHFSPEK